MAALVLTATAVIGPLPAAGAVAQAPPDTFVFTGSGYGHGVGMSQYGAYFQAQEGRSAQQILEHYYTGTTVAPVEEARSIRVNLLHGVSTASASGAGGDLMLSADATPPVTAADGQAAEFGVDGADVVVRLGGASVLKAGVVQLTWGGGAVLNVVGPGESLGSSGHRYRYGTADVAVVNGALEVVNTLNLHEEYLRGLAEVPSSWPSATLEAQAIAGRTYALRKLRAGVRQECRCHVYDSVSDQVFAGVVKETGSDGRRWVRAVAATSPDSKRGLVVMAGERLASTNYFSSSAGRTENNEDIFGGAAAPELRSVDDHWSLDPRNPKSSWTLTRTQEQLATAFGLSDVVALDLGTRTAGGQVKTAVATSSTGATASLKGQEFRRSLQLHSAAVSTSSVGPGGSVGSGGPDGGDQGRPVRRLAGGDRYSTSVAIGRAASPAPGPAAGPVAQQGTAVVLAAGDPAHLVDGLVAAPLARQRRAPLLLTEVRALPDSVAADIAERRPATIFVVGGEAAVSREVEEAARALGSSVVRLGGSTRYDTGLAVALELRRHVVSSTVLIASGEPDHLVDALAAGGPASGSGQAVLLVAADAVPEPTARALAELGATTTNVAGGEAAIGERALAGLPEPRRLAGVDRYATAVAVTDAYVGTLRGSVVSIGSGADGHLVDALSGGALGGLVLLTEPSSLATVTETWLKAHPAVGEVLVLGGPAAVQDSTLRSVQRTAAA